MAKRRKQNNLYQERDPVTGAFVSKVRLPGSSSGGAGNASEGQVPPGEGSPPPGVSLGQGVASGSILEDYVLAATTRAVLGERPGVSALRRLMVDDPKSFYAAYREERDREHLGTDAEAVAGVGDASGPAVSVGGGSGGVSVAVAGASSDASPGVEFDEGSHRAFRLLEELITEFKAGVR